MNNENGNAVTANHGANVKIETEFHDKKLLDNSKVIASLKNKKDIISVTKSDSRVKEKEIFSKKTVNRNDSKKEKRIEISIGSRSAKDITGDDLTSGPTRKPGRRWTAKEDLILRNLVEQNGNRHWKRIATEFSKACGSNRSDVQCLHRWNKCLKPGLTKGPWTVEEDETIKLMIRQHGSTDNIRWSVIAKMLNGRLGKQVRERWINHLDPTINKGDWTPKEDENLYQLQKRFGNRWKWIAELMPGRSENGVKNRWHSIKQLLKKQQESENAMNLVNNVKKSDLVIPAGRNIKGNSAVTEVTRTVTAAAVAAAVAAAKASKKQKKTKRTTLAGLNGDKIDNPNKKRAKNTKTSTTTTISDTKQETNPINSDVRGGDSNNSLAKLLTIGRQCLPTNINNDSDTSSSPNGSVLSPLTPGMMDITAISNIAKEMLAKTESFQEMTRASLQSPTTPNLQFQIENQVAQQIALASQVGFGFPNSVAPSFVPGQSPPNKLLPIEPDKQAISSLMQLSAVTPQSAPVADTILFNQYYSMFANKFNGNNNIVALLAAAASDKQKQQ